MHKYMVNCELITIKTLSLGMIFRILLDVLLDKLASHETGMLNIIFYSITHLKYYVIMSVLGQTRQKFLHKVFVGQNCDIVGI